jgi:hypothetical protein
MTEPTLNVSFHPDIFKVFLNHLRETFHDAGDSILFQMSKNFSHEAMRIIGQQLGVRLDADPAMIIEIFSNHMHSNGWGIFSMRKQDYQEFRKCEETVMHYFYRGMLVGFFEFLMRRSMMIKQNETITEDGAIIFYVSQFSS